MFWKVKNKRGRPLYYEDISKLKMIIYFRIHGIFKATKMVEELNEKKLVMRFFGLQKVPSHDVISDFLERVEPVIEGMFQNIVQQAISLRIIKGERVAMDPTSIETRYKSDKDAKWNKDITRNRWYFGYGGNVVFDPESHLPITGMLTRGKKAEIGEPEKLVEKTMPLMKLLGTHVFLGDGEFDTIELQKDLLDQHILPIIPYNPRNTTTPLPITFRIQEWTNTPCIEWLEDEHTYRAEAEHSWSTLKEHFGLEKVHYRGWKKVKSHFFLCLMTRVMYAIAVFKNYPDVSARRISVGL